MTIAKVLFLSRHTMTAEQSTDLVNLIIRSSPGEYTSVEVITENMTFPARAEGASSVIMAKAKEVGAEYIAGVFPAHIAVELYRDLAFNDNPLYMLCPVSVPAPAVEGETRGAGFVHSHWELFCAE